MTNKGKDHKKRSEKDKPSNREKSLSKSSQLMMDQRLWLKILVGMVFGVITGLALSPAGPIIEAKETAFAVGEWLSLPGTLFLGMIQMVIIPLIVCSIILGIAESGSMDFLKSMGSRLIPYFILTTIISITIGVTLVQIVRPGDMINQGMALEVLNSGAASDRLSGDTFEDLTIPQRIANIIPTNPARAQVERNMLQIVIASILVGIALITIPAGTGKPFKDLCVAGQVLSMKIISWAMVIAPYAVFGLLCNITIRIGLDALISLGFYAATVLTGLGCMMLVYLTIIALFTKKSPGEFMKGIREVQLLAFSTSSSAATMPFSIQAAEEKLGLRPEVSRFVVPLGATVNMDGTALYQAVAALFLCQVFGIDLSTPEIAILMLTTVGASIGTPATPGVGIVVLATILVGIGVPAQAIALIIGVDRILDMCRTTVNVTGDLAASTVMDRWLPEKKK
ncbi:MAG: dicarboxylate/amino acid:cation symporter [Micavibrio sp.]|nr:MAG: dicarboxylate/amino acid:cation symporter [Micavibrio sp.]